MKISGSVKVLVMAWWYRMGQYHISLLGSGPHTEYTALWQLLLNELEGVDV